MRILSGIQPSGALHLGNYFGMMRPAIELQEQGEAFYFVANYHSMTSLFDAEERRRNSLDVALDLAQATSIRAAIEVNLRLAAVAVVEVHLRLATGPEVRRALEVTHRRARSAADMRGAAVVGVPLVIISGAGLAHRDAEGHSRHEGGACG